MKLIGNWMLSLGASAITYCGLSCKFQVHVVVKTTGKSTQAKHKTITETEALSSAAHRRSLSLSPLPAKAFKGNKE